MSMRGAMRSWLHWLMALLDVRGAYTVLMNRLGLWCPESEREAISPATPMGAPRASPCVAEPVLGGALSAPAALLTDNVPGLTGCPTPHWGVVSLQTEGERARASESDSQRQSEGARGGE